MVPRNAVFLVASLMLTSCQHDWHNHVRAVYADDFGCEKSAVQVTETGEGRYKVTGCDNACFYKCFTDTQGTARCGRPNSIIRTRFSRQFDCPAGAIKIRYLDGDAWEATGCKHVASFLCNPMKGGDFQCVLESIDSKPVSREKE